MRRILNLLLVTLGFIGSSVFAAEATKPNIVFILAEDLGLDAAA